MEVRSHEYNNHSLKRFQGVLEAIYHHLEGEMVCLARGICSIPEVNFCSTLNSRINSS